MKSFYLIPLAFLLAFSSCSSKQDVNTQREVASTSLEVNENYAAAFEEDFRKNFKSANANEVFGDKLLKEGISKAFYHMYKFDEQLNSAYEKCITDGAEDCSSPIDTQDYKKLQAYRSINETLKEKFVYYHMRLLDIANYEDRKLKVAFQSTKNQMEEKDSNIAEEARVARSILNDLSQKAKEGLKSDISKNPLEFYTASVMSEIREAAETVYYPMAGVSEFKVKKSQSLNEVQKEIITDEFSKAIKSYSLKNTIKEELLHSEVIKSLKVMNNRVPQNSWKNHTGRSFKTGDWALTYDDGPHATFSPRIMNILKDKGWHATFFWLASLSTRPENKSVIAKAKSLGMGLASHSYTHARLTKPGVSAQKEIVDAKRVLEKAYGMKLNFFRLPYGAGTNSASIKNVITSQNLEHFFWNVDSLDWQDPSPRSIYNRVIKQMRLQKKGIILFHDIRQRTVDVTKMLADNLSRDISGAKIIRLEDGAGVGTANGNNTSEPRVPLKYPHERRITASKLNVRTSPVDGKACGALLKDEVVEITSRDSSSGWFAMKSREIRSSHTCAGTVYISDSSSFSEKD